MPSIIEQAYRDWSAARTAIARTDIDDDRILDHYRNRDLALARLAQLPIRTPREAGQVLEAALAAVDQLPEPALSALLAVQRFLDAPAAAAVVHPLVEINSTKTA